MCSITLANLPSAKPNLTESTQWAGMVLGGPTAPPVTLLPSSEKPYDCETGKHGKSQCVPGGEITAILFY